MEKIIYTQRVDTVESYQEIRDCTDRRIPKFIEVCGYLPIPMPNILSMAEFYIQELKPTGIVLTGGNSLIKYGGNTNERDSVEKRLIELAIQNDIPVLGICRGMQMIADYFGELLQNVENHVGTQHEITWKNKKRMVNSYHNQALINCSELFQVIRADDGIIESIYHNHYKIQGIMWHPERQEPFEQLDIEIFKKFFRKEDEV